MEYKKNKGCNESQTRPQTQTDSPQELRTDNVCEETERPDRVPGIPPVVSATEGGL